MGWNDREPHFSRINRRADEIEEKDGLPYEAAYEKALDTYIDDIKTAEKGDGDAAG